MCVSTLKGSNLHAYDKRVRLHECDANARAAVSDTEQRLAKYLPRRDHGRILCKILQAL